MNFSTVADHWRPAIAVVLLVVLLAWETLQPYFGLFGGGREGWLKRGRHGLINLVIGTINALMIALVFTAVWLATTTWAETHQIGLLHWIGMPGLDPITSKEIVLLMKSIQEKYKTSSIVITHDVDCARFIADRMILLIDGINYIMGTYLELSQSEDPKVKAFFKQ